jgi:diaminopimelate epimerase
MTNDRLFIDLNDIVIEDVEILAQEGGRGMADFAASCGTGCCAANACSCTVKEPVKPGGTVTER